MFLFKGKKVSTTQDPDQDPLVAIDIGSSKIRLIAGEPAPDNKIKINYYAEKPSVGVSNSTISDLDKLTQKLAEMVREYEESGKLFSHCSLGISGRYIDFKNRDGYATVPTHTVTELDRDNAIENASAMKLSDNQKILSSIPQDFKINEVTDIINPVGMKASRLDVSVHVITCSENQEQNLRSAITTLSPRFNVDHVIFNGIAAADAVLLQEEKEMGVCLINFGASSIDVAVYDRGKLIISFGLDKGGINVTRDIAINHGIPLTTAEYLKLTYGIAHPMLLTDKEQGMLLGVPVNNDKKGDTVCISRKDLAYTIGVSLCDPFRQISGRLERLNNGNKIKSNFTLGAGFVITGGVAGTQGIGSLAFNFLRPNIKGARNVRVAAPRDIITDREELLSPECATAVGLLKLGLFLDSEEERRQKSNNERKSSNNVFSRVANWTKDWLSNEF